MTPTDIGLGNQLNCVGEKLKCRTSEAQWNGLGGLTDCSSFIHGRFKPIRHRQRPIKGLMARTSATHLSRHLTGMANPSLPLHYNIFCFASSMIKQLSLSSSTSTHFKIMIKDKYSKFCTLGHFSSDKISCTENRKNGCTYEYVCRYT